MCEMHVIQRLNKHEVGKKKKKNCANQLYLATLLYQEAMH